MGTMPPEPMGTPPPKPSSAAGFNEYFTTIIIAHNNHSHEASLPYSKNKVFNKDPCIISGKAC